MFLVSSHVAGASHAVSTATDSLSLNVTAVRLIIEEASSTGRPVPFLCHNRQLYVLVDDY